ncbi:MAG: RNA polymerase sigma factor [Bacteroidetes bacterium]|nr:RNA polymerase sigma factor [Bacteroidota bacterium]
MQVDEEVLIDGCLKDDRRIQKLLYDKYCKAMYTTAYRILKDYDDANDALQESFIKVFKNISQFKGESTLGAWIKMIVVRTTLKYLKEKRTFITLDDYTEDDVNIISDSIDGMKLHHAILSLPEGYRTIFLLTEVEGYKHREVAEMLNISIETSKSQLCRAKKLLKEMLISEIR